MFITNLKRNTMKKQLVVCALLLVSTGLYAQKQTFVREYTYRAGMNESELSAKNEALRQMKIELLEYLGVLVSSYAILRTQEEGGEVSESYIREVQVYAMRVIETRVLDSRWNGQTYWVKAELTANVGQIQRELEEARKKWQAEELRQRQAQRPAAAAKTPPPPKPPKDPPPPSPFIEKGQNSYVAWSAVNMGYSPFTLSSGVAGRNGGIVGIGYYASVGLEYEKDKRHYEPSREYYNDNDSKGGVHYSAGIKFFPYKNFFLSAGYGTFGFERTFRDNNDYKKDIWEQRQGLQFTAGYDIFDGEVGFVSFSAGVSTNSMGVYPLLKISLGLAGKP